MFRGSLFLQCGFGLWPAEAVRVWIAFGHHKRYIALGSHRKQAVENPTAFCAKASYFSTFFLQDSLLGCPGGFFRWLPPNNLVFWFFFRDPRPGQHPDAFCLHNVARLICSSGSNVAEVAYAAVGKHPFTQICSIALLCAHVSFLYSVPKRSEVAAAREVCGVYMLKDRQDRKTYRRADALRQLSGIFWCS